MDTEQSRFSISKSMRNERGATMVEYGLWVAVFAVASVAAITQLKDDTEKSLTQSGKALLGGEVPVDEVVVDF